MVARNATTVALELPSDVSSPSAARAFLREALAEWHLERFGDVVELLTDELVSNVVRHVGAPMQVRVGRRSSALRVEVDDPSTTPPVYRDPDPSDDHGRGIQLIARLAVGWGVDLRDGGKTVWFEIDVGDARAEG